MFRKNWLLFSIILFVGIALRFTNLNRVPPSLNWDEVAIGWNAHSIWEAHIDEYGKRFPLSFQSYGDFKAPLLIYGTAPFVGLFGLNVWTIRLPSAIAGSLTVAVIYFLAFEIGKLIGFKKPHLQIFALLTMALTAVSPWHLMFSRGAYEANIALFFITTGVWLWLVGLSQVAVLNEAKQSKQSLIHKLKFTSTLFISGLSFILALYTYHSPKIFLLFFLPTVLILFRKKISIGIWKTKYISALAIIVLILVSTPIIYENLKGHGAERIGTSIFFQDGQVRSFDRSLVLDIVNNFRAHLSPAFYINGDTRNLRNTLKYYGLMPTIQLIFFLIGIIYLIKLPKEKSKYALFLLLWFIYALIPGALSRGLEVPHNLRTFNALPAIMLVTSFGVIMAVTELKETLTKQKSASAMLKGFYIFTISSFVISLGFYFFEYYIQYPVYAAQSWQYGYQEAVTFAKSYEDQVEQIKITTEYGQPHIFTYFFQNRRAMEVLWGGTRKYHYNVINWESDQYLLNRLLVGTPNEIPEQIPDDKGQIVKEINFPDGTVAFRIVKTK